MTAATSITSHRSDPVALTMEEIVEIVLAAIADASLERDDPQGVDAGLDTPLFGADGVLDSLGLVSVITDVEFAVSDRIGRPMSLMDDRALEQEQSPFTSVRALAEYVIELHREP
jgi:acyl carrier protein